MAQMQTAHWFRAAVLSAFCLVAWLSRSLFAGPPATDSPLVKLLKSGRVPEARQGTIVDMIGKRGTAADLAFIYQKAIEPSSFPVAMRARALDALAEAALTRNLRPDGKLDALVHLLEPSSKASDPALTRATIHLAGLWKLEAAAENLEHLAQAEGTPDETRWLACQALADIGGQPGLARINALVRDDRKPGVRLPAVAALARLDMTAAAGKAIGLLPDAVSARREITPLFAAFLDRQGGADILAAAVSHHPVPADAAKIALRSVYALGHADQSLVNALSRAAGLAAEMKPLSSAELAAMVNEVAAKGDPARGELIFRRADLNCMSCHALNKAGGEIGPDLSAIGQTSPADYIINSILNPDQSIKEQFHTLVVQTSDGQVLQGIVTDKDTQRIILKDATGTPRIVPVSSIEEQKPGGSLMPKGLVNLMTRAEFLDLVRFLSELGKPGPYAIRGTPNIQRWRFLKPTPTPVAHTFPDAGLFVDQVLHAPPEHWLPAYARVSGFLSLDDLPGVNDSTLAYLQGELNVTTAGPLRIQLDAADGVRSWVDEKPLPANAAEFTMPLAAGRHAVTLAVDCKARQSRTVKVELTKPRDSEAAFTVVGGR
jgi:putative heme-binding domain-containing protein